jgi:hypothetical protein
MTILVPAVRSICWTVIIVTMIWITIVAER